MTTTPRHNHPCADTELARDAGNRLPARTRITSVWTEETTDGGPPRLLATFKTRSDAGSDWS